MQVRTTKDQGLYNKPSAAVHPGALAAIWYGSFHMHQYKQSGGQNSVFDT